MRRILAAGAALLMAMGALTLTTGSAASLSLTTTPGVFVTSASACAPGTANGSPVMGAAVAGNPTAGSYSQVRLSNIAAGCRNLPIEVFVHGAQGALIASTATPSSASSSALTVNVGNYPGANVAKVIVRIGGWLFPTTWTAPAPVNPTPPVGPIVCYKLNANGTVVTDAAGNGVRCSSVPSVMNVQPWGDDVWSAANLQVRYSVASNEPAVLLVFNFDHSRFSAYRGDLNRTSIQLAGYNGTNTLRGPGTCVDASVVEVVHIPGNNVASGHVQLISQALTPGTCTG